jgi:hypothetical protein
MQSSNSSQFFDDLASSNDGRARRNPSGWGSRSAGRPNLAVPAEEPVTEEPPGEQKPRRRKRNESTRRWRRNLLVGGTLVLVGTSGAYALRQKERPILVKLGGPASAALDDTFEASVDSLRWPSINAFLTANGITTDSQEAHGSQLTVDLKIPPGSTPSGLQTRADFRRIASALEELDASGSDLPAVLPSSLSQQLESAHVKLVRLPGDYRLECGDERYSSLEGFVDAPSEIKHTLVADKARSGPFSLKLGARTLPALAGWASGGVLQSNPDLQTLTASYDFAHHRGTVWLRGAKISDTQPKGDTASALWRQLPDATTSLVGETEFVQALVTTTNPHLRKSLPGRLWVGHEGWQGLALQASLTNLARVSGWIGRSQVALAWIGSTDPKSSLAEGQHGIWSFSQPDHVATLAKAGFAQNAHASPPPVRMWKSRELPSPPRAMGRFNLVGMPGTKDHAQTTISWVGGGNSRAAWVCFQDQPAPPEEVPGVAVMGPEVKSVHRIHPTILVGQ